MVDDLGGEAPKYAEVKDLEGIRAEMRGDKIRFQKASYFLKAP